MDSPQLRPTKRGHKNENFVHRYFTNKYLCFVRNHYEKQNGNTAILQLVDFTFYFCVSKFE